MFKSPSFRGECTYFLAFVINTDQHDGMRVDDEPVEEKRS
jgi:hypothetical protein